MLSTPEGIRFLTEDKLLKQLLDCFNELDQVGGIFKPYIDNVTHVNHVVRWATDCSTALCSGSPGGYSNLRIL